VYEGKYLKKEKDLIVNYIRDHHNIELKDLPDFDDYLDIAIKNIISLKIWSNYLKKSGAIPYGPMYYFDEIASNLNQILILGIVGYRIPSYIMLRRSQENYLMFLYYIDHPIEFYKKEENMINRDFLRLKSLKEYIVEYPFDAKYEIEDLSTHKKLMKKVVESWSNQYTVLSNFVHGSSKDYFDLKTYLDDINSNNEILISLKKELQIFGSILNTTNILFFLKIYNEFDEREKSLIRLSISSDEDFKKDLSWIW
jgi:hypothetical protein